MYVQLLDSVGNSNFRLWKLENQTESFKSIFNDINTQYITTKKVYINGKQIESSTANVMTLNLDEDSLLIVENLPDSSNEFAFQAIEKIKMKDEIEMNDFETKNGNNRDLKDRRKISESSSEISVNEDTIKSNINNSSYKSNIMKEKDIKIIGNKLFYLL